MVMHEENQELERIDDQANDLLEAVNISHSDVDTIHANSVQASQSNINALTASDVEVRMSVVSQANSDNLTAHQAMIASSQADVTHLDQSNVGYVRSTELTMDKSAAIALYTDSLVQVDSKTGILISREVSGGPFKSTLVIAGKINGPVDTMLDTPKAALAGVIAGSVVGLFLILGKLLFGNRNT